MDWPQILAPGTQVRLEYVMCQLSHKAEFVEMRLKREHPRLVGAESPR
jgi:hypothetical protein